MDIEKVRKHYQSLDDGALADDLARGPSAYATPEVWQVVLAESTRRGLGSGQATAMPDDPRTRASVSSAEVLTYKQGAYCQLRLASGERVLVSCSQAGVKIMKLSFGGLIPTSTIAEWSLEDAIAVAALFADPNDPAGDVLEEIRVRLMDCRSINEIRQRVGA